jgi:murein DD-endopeptidase MepM/ murein hydrolase activator NlpD
MRKRISALVAAILVAIVLPAAVIAHWPVADRYAWVSQGYWSGHRAYDLAAPMGTPVVPIRAGVVVFAGWRNNCGGYQVWVSHGNGLYSGYYHLERGTISVWRGESVKVDYSRLGRVGESGCATGPHTHVKVWRGYPWASGSYRVSPWAYIDSGTWLPYRYR